MLHREQPAAQSKKWIVDFRRKKAKIQTCLHQWSWGGVGEQFKVPGNIITETMSWSSYVKRKLTSSFISKGNLCQVLVYFNGEGIQIILTGNSTSWHVCAGKDLQHHPENQWYPSTHLLKGNAVHPSTIWQEIQKYPPPYHQTTGQRISSGCETPELILCMQI